jgi:hypothetical protein
MSTFLVLRAGFPPDAHRVRKSVPTGYAYIKQAFKLMIAGMFLRDEGWRRTMYGYECLYLETTPLWMY